MGSIYGTEADVFSLGVTLYTIVAKKYPYKDVCVDGRPILAYCYGTPPKYKKKRFEMHVPKGDNCQDHECEHSLANLIGKMLEENPEDRIDLNGILEHPFMKAPRHRSAPKPPLFEPKQPKQLEENNTPVLLNLPFELEPPVFTVEDKLQK